MTMILLANWNTVFINYLFDEDKKRIVKRKWGLKYNKQSKDGHVSYERNTNFIKHFYALYVLNNTLVFQAAKFTWDISKPDYKASFSRKSRFISSFILYKNSIEIYRCNYFNIFRHLWGSLSSTYDYIDFEHDHFLLHVAEVINDKECIKNIISLND
jgi:hypothetical protein